MGPSVPKYLRGNPGIKLPCQNIKRLHTGSISLHSPHSLLVDSDGLLTEGERAGFRRCSHGGGGDWSDGREGDE